MHGTARAVLHISHIQNQVQTTIKTTPALYASVCRWRLHGGWELLDSWIKNEKLAGAGWSTLSCMQAGKGTQQQTGSQKLAKLAAETTTGLLAVEGEVPIMMPAKLATNKACVCV